MHNKHLKRRDKGFYRLAASLALAATLVCSMPLCAEETAHIFTLKSSIEHAMEKSTRMLSSVEEVASAEAEKKQQATEFFPKFSARYTYKRADEAKTIGEAIVTSPQDLYQMTATVAQPIFTGLSKITRYQISALGLDVAKLLEEQTRQDLILAVKKAYFELLQMEKLERVARQAVTQLTAHAHVAGNFFEVGMTPRNDLLEAEVELANAKQDHVVSMNNVEVARARFNTLLRRSIEMPVTVEDVMTYDPFTGTYESCVETALNNRVEIEIAARRLEIAEKDVKLTRKDYYPGLDVQANYYKKGDNPDLDGGVGIYDRDEWDVVATASWTFWEWGKTGFGVGEKLARLQQARLDKEADEDNIRQEVKEAYLGVKQAEQNILTACKAVEQARENFRMNEERYKEQVATSTEVLDAQTLLTKTETNYFNALSEFNISKAKLNRAIGLKVIDRP